MNQRTAVFLGFIFAAFICFALDICAPYCGPTKRLQHLNFGSAGLALWALGYMLYLWQR
jgi:hypothetical protein